MPFLKKFLFAVFLFLSVSLCVSPPRAHAKSPYIGNLAVINSPDGLRINATLINGFSRKVAEALQSGVPIVVQYDIELKERRTFFSDENIVKRVIKREVAYSSLEKEFKFSIILGSSNKTETLKSLREVRDSMIQLQGVHVIASNYLKPNEEYYIRVKGTMHAKSYWFPFNYILFFMDFLNFETSWVESATIVINKFPVIDKPGQPEEPVEERE
jgi:hypothetical protein